MSPRRVFLLSPARLDGKRASYLFNDQARFELALKLRTPQGAEIGEVFRFLSGLYFRGKLAYAGKFGRGPGHVSGALVITTNRGLLPATTMVTVADLREMAGVPIDVEESRYRGPLERDLGALCKALGTGGEAVLLGSIATAKYVDILSGCLGARLRFPVDFVGRGDMSRGTLMLRHAASGEELAYSAIEADVARTGKRAARVR